MPACLFVTVISNRLIEAMRYQNCGRGIRFTRSPGDARFYFNTHHVSTNFNRVIPSAQNANLFNWLKRCIPYGPGSIQKPSGYPLKLLCRTGYQMHYCFDHLYLFRMDRDWMMKSGGVRLSAHPYCAALWAWVKVKAAYLQTRWLKMRISY
jgi:hypothetical protein